VLRTLKRRLPKEAAASGRGQLKSIPQWINFATLESAMACNQPAQISRLEKEQHGSAVLRVKLRRKITPENCDHRTGHALLLTRGFDFLAERPLETTQQVRCGKVAQNVSVSPV
jgi:hypothetical protein